MQLPKTRLALRQAEDALDELGDHEDNADRFRDKFVSCVGMIQRVGAILDGESKGHRTSAFGAFWKTTQDNPHFHFMADVRNAEFKRGEDRKTASHQLGLSSSVTTHSSLNIQITHDGEVVGETTVTDPPPVNVPEPEPTHTMAWYFKGGDYDGDEVLPFLRNYMDWIRNIILPEAEKLTSDS
jgi:hypothetical protein